MHEIKTGNIYEDFRNNKEMFDFSNYSTKSTKSTNITMIQTNKLLEK